MKNFPVISPQYPLILASASPRRKSLLAQLGIPFHSVASGVTEIEAGADPQKASLAKAEKKARDVYGGVGQSWVLGADTTVSAGIQILGKPGHSEDAKEMLSRLSGKEHSVITGFCILNPAGRTAHAETVTTLVRFRSLTGTEIEGYVRTGEPFGKAGSYAIQGRGAFLVESISGSYTNVVGLPLCALVKALVSARALKGFPL